MPRLNGVEVEDTFAELFEMWAGRIIITAENEKWAQTAANVATGYGSSIIASPAEAGIESTITQSESPDGRPGIIIQIYHTARKDLKKQMIGRIGQCVMTCPTTTAFDGLPSAARRLRVGRSLRFFGDGFQKKDNFKDRIVWRIPVMEGEFVVQSSFGAVKAAAGGNLLIFASTQKSGLQAAEEAVNSIRRNAKNVIMPFPGGICRSGSKVGSLKYKLPASTNHPFCPTLRDAVADSQVPKNVRSVYEIVVNGLDLESVKKAMKEGIAAATKVEGVAKISAGNYGGKIGPMKIFLRELV
jgi:formylmethanofuran--tetrahydromethanopterin N-formyltransferase